MFNLCNLFTQIYLCGNDKVKLFLWQMFSLNVNCVEKSYSQLYLHEYFFMRAIPREINIQ